MPNARGHLIGGAAFYAVAVAIPWTRKFLPFASPGVIFVGFVFCLIGALFPDIDTHSEGRKLLNVMVLIAFAAAIHYRLYAVALLLAPLPFLARLAFHRGVTHNPLFVCALPALIFYTLKSHIKWLPEINRAYYAAYIVGGLSHIILDVIQTAYKRSLTAKARQQAKQKADRHSWW